MSGVFACTLASSSAGNATLFSTGTTHILLDAGISSRAMSKALARFSLTQRDLSAVLITHEHGDHTACLPFLPPCLPVYSTLGVAARVEYCNNAVAPGVPFNIGDVSVVPFTTPHDTPDSAGYLISYDGFNIALATDMGHVPNDMLPILRQADVLFIESNYDEEMLYNGRYLPFLKKRIAGSRGHLSNNQCAAAVLSCARHGRLKHIVLMHLSKDNNTPELAYGTTEQHLRDHGVRINDDLTLRVAPRSQPCEPIYAGSAERESICCGCDTY